jgi:hypothetical protein
MPPRTLAFVGAVALLGFGSAAWILAHTRMPDSPLYLLTLVATLVLGRVGMVVDNPGPASRSQLTLGVFFSLSMFGIGPTIVVVLVSVLLFCLSLPKRSNGWGTRTVFNLAANTLAVISAALVARAIDQRLKDPTHVVPVVASAVAAFIVVSSLVAIAVSLSEGDNVVDVWKRVGLTSAAWYLTLACAGSAAGVILQEARGGFVAAAVVCLPAYLAYRSIQQEVRASHEMSQRLDAARQEADTDLLTALPSRRAFLSRCGQELDRARRTSQSVAVLMIDLDGFKVLNDTFGRAVGDMALQVVATCLRIRFAATTWPRGWLEMSSWFCCPTVMNGARKFDAPICRRASASCRCRRRWGVSCCRHRSEPLCFRQTATRRMNCWRRPIDRCTRTSSSDRFLGAELRATGPAP